MHPGVDLHMWRSKGSPCVRPQCHCYVTRPLDTAREILTVYIEISASLNLLIIFSLRTREVHFRPNNSFVLLVVVFLKKMTIISININFSLFPNTVVINYFYDYLHKIC